VVLKCRDNQNGAVAREQARSEIFVASLIFGSVP
jgi:hypothetical protein